MGKIADEYFYQINKKAISATLLEWRDTLQAAESQRVSAYFRGAVADHFAVAGEIECPSESSAGVPRAMQTVPTGLAEVPPSARFASLWRSGGACARTFNFPGDREMVRDRSAKMASTLPSSACKVSRHSKSVAIAILLIW